MKRHAILAALAGGGALFCLCILAPLGAEESFGFAAPESAAPVSGVALGGSVEIGTSAFVSGLSDLGSVELGDLASASLKIAASGSGVDAYLRLKYSSALAQRHPEEIFSEARLRVSLGALSLEGGLLKLAWGKADSQGPLDVLNPLDLSDLSVTDAMERKLARPMLHGALGLGGLSRLEAVYLPSFEGHRMASSGPWEPARLAALDAQIGAASSGTLSLSALLPATASLEYSQAGLRFTTTTGRVDWGLQGFYGYLPTPAVLYSPPATFTVSYNRYCQAGADLAAALAGFNLRAEAAANVTEDTQGDDPGVYNPALAFSLGFDRELFSGFTLNVQYAGTYRLLDDEISLASDVEASSEAFASTLTAVLTQSLFKDRLSLKLIGLWGVRDEDWLLTPSVSYKIGDAALELSAGLFGGAADGDLGQFSGASYLKVVASYEF
jgi:hypothetical protein